MRFPTPPRHEEHLRVGLGDERRLGAARAVEDRVAAVRVPRHQSLEMHALHPLAPMKDAARGGHGLGDGDLTLDGAAAVEDDEDARRRLALLDDRIAVPERFGLKQADHPEQSLPWELVEHGDRRDEDGALGRLLRVSTNKASRHFGFR